MLISKLIEKTRYKQLAKLAFVYSDEFAKWQEENPKTKHLFSTFFIDDLLLDHEIKIVQVEKTGVVIQIKINCSLPSCQESKFLNNPDFTTNVIKGALDSFCDALSLYTTNFLCDDKDNY